MLKDTLKEISGHSFLYALAWFANGATSLLLLPVYTKYLSTSDYGILELLDYMSTILSILVIGGLNLAVPRLYNDVQYSHKKNYIISTTIMFVILSGALLVGLGFFFNGTLARGLLGKLSYRNLVNLSLISMYGQIIFSVTTVYFIVTKRSGVYLFYALLRLGINIILNLYFIVVLGLGIAGMLWGNLISNSLLAILGGAHSVHANGIKFDLRILRKILQFAFPLIPATFMAMIMHSADRVFIRLYCSLNDVGIYGVGYKFPWMLNALILQSVGFVWTGTTMYEISKKTDSAYVYGRMTTYFMSFYIFMQLFLSVFSRQIVSITTDTKFFTAHAVIPIISLGLCFHAFDMFFSPGVYLKDKTTRRIWAYLPAALTNVVGNILLLPRFGYIAAAWMTVLSYLVFCIAVYISGRNLIAIRFEFKRLLMLFLAGGAVLFASEFYTLGNFWLDALKGLGCICLFLLLLVVFRFFTAGELESLRQLSESWYNKFRQ